MEKPLTLALIVFACCLLIIGGAKLCRLISCHQLKPDWQTIIRQDLKCMYELILENHPGAINQQDPSFVQRMEKHYAQALARIPQVSTEAGYRFLLEWFAHSFNDCHVWVEFDAKVQGVDVDWCGIIMLYKNGKYHVGYVDSSWPIALPPVGAELIACDEKSVHQRMVDDVMVYANCLEHLEADKVKMAPRLLINYKNPWCRRPIYAIFGINGKKVPYKLVWQNVPKAELTNKIVLALGLKNNETRFELKEMVNNGLWVSAPTFDPHAEEVGQLQLIIEKIATLRNKSYVVFDIRGNGGGSDVYALNLLEQLYGEKYITSVFDYYIEAFRVTAKNRLFFANLYQQRKGENALSDILLLKLVKLLEEQPIDSLAILKVEAKNNMHDIPCPLFKGTLFVVTDYACFSSSLNFLDMIKAIPGSTHIGLPTRADTKYCDTAFNELPSKLAKCVFPRAVVLNRKRSDNIPYIPDYRFDDIQNTAALQEWVVHYVKNHYIEEPSVVYKFYFKPVEEKDLPLLYKWFKQPHVAQWWPVPDEHEDFFNSFLKRIRFGTQPYLVLCNDRPIGYIQTYSIDVSKDRWLPDLSGNIIGIDQFIGEPEYLGKGIGTLFIKAFVANLVAKDKTVTIVVDPDPTNAAAIRCYEKVGFKKIGAYEAPWGPALIMIYRKE